MFAVVGAALAGLAACDRGPPHVDRSVTISWEPNREKGVNGPGGGYRVDITGRPTLDLPFDPVAGFAPTSLTTVLHTGFWAVKVTAYQPLDAAAGNTGGASAPSTILVPIR
jgi:hypothetical protein